VTQIDTADEAESCLSSGSTAAGAKLDEKLEGVASLVDSLTDLG
jgi:hypothetical protein